MMIRTSIWMGCLLCLVVSMTGCGDANRMEKSFDEECWSMQDTLRLELAIEDTQKVYSLSFPLVVTDAYPYENIYLQAWIKAPSGDMNQVPSQFVLADKGGRWQTEPDGDGYPFELTVADGIRFNQAGTYEVSLIHFMRDDRLCGVRTAGISLTPQE